MSDNNIKPFDLQETIDDFIDYFDWECVNDVMEYLNWRWATTGNGIPSIPDMKKHARKYLREVAEGVLKQATEKPDLDSVNYFTSTGGFNYEATKYKDSDKIYLKMHFAVSEWSNYDQNSMNDISPLEYRLQYERLLSENKDLKKEIELLKTDRDQYRALVALLSSVHSNH